LGAQGGVPKIQLKERKLFEESPANGERRDFEQIQKARGE
jgi:hypothetical protein